jgi:uncharacterized protein (TIGR03083 family)
MDNARYLECLAADAGRLRLVAEKDLGAAVPSCPGWSMTDLVRHVAVVYLHKVECMRHGQEPEHWPPPGVENAEPIALFDRAYTALTTAFGRHPADAPGGTWYPPDDTVGFWFRRMAQETVIHRVDAELAAGHGVTAIPDDLALDGIDEVLETFLAFGTRGWPQMFADKLAGGAGDTVAVRTGGRGWLVHLGPEVVRVQPGESGAAATAQVGGDPHAVLLWLWRRVDADAVELSGDRSTVDRLRDLLGVATQ